MNLLQFCWKQLTTNAFQFAGRTNRPDFWKFTSIQLFIIFCLIAITKLVLISETTYEIVSTLFFLTTITQWIAITIRKLHNSNKSAWRLLVIIIPIIELIAMIVFMIQESDDFENKYGTNPNFIQE